jgi:sugar porter (SP) family MFS transporter
LKATAGTVIRVRTSKNMPDCSESNRADLIRVNTGYLYLVSLVATIGGFLFGYDLDVIIGALLFVRIAFHFTPLQLGFAVSSAAAGCVVGPLLGGSISDWLGRKKTLAITALVFAAGTIGTVFPTSVMEFDFFRFVGGLGVGLASVVSPMYISEIAPASMRGRLVTVNQLAIMIGALCSIVVDYFLSLSGNWRGMFASELVPVCLFLAGLIVMPESPRWLLYKEHLTKAREVLLKIYDASGAEREFLEIYESLGERKTRISELLHPGLRRSLLIGVTLAILQQFTGVSPVISYMPIIFEQAGFHSPSAAILQTTIVMAWSFLWTLVAFWLVDRVGRRPLLLVGTVGMGAGMLLMGIFIQLRISGVFVVAAMMLSMAFYVTSLAPLTWLIMSEIFPTRLRGRAMAVCSVFLWLANFMSTQIFPSFSAYMQSRFNSTGGIYWLFAVICVGAFLFAWRFVPETKGRSLEEISKSWKADAPSEHLPV